MTMAPIPVFDLLKRRALVTRESAHNLQPLMAAAAQSDEAVEITLDFLGVEAVTPSFVDEVLGLITTLSPEHSKKPLRVTFLNPPTRLSSKFAAIARARGVVIEDVNGAWAISQQSA